MVNKKINKLASNCSSCITKPCQIGCPLNNDITAFIKEIKRHKYKKAFDILSSTSILMPICGRICPHIKQCEGACIKGNSTKKVLIGKLETFIGDMWLKQNWPIHSPKKTTKKVAVIGSGPAGLTCAAFLRKNGIGVTIYEKHNYLGGLLSHGIPKFRLPKKIVKNVINNIINLGIDVKYNTELGKDISIEELKNEYDAIFLAIGANVSNNLNIPGEKLLNVYGANELLENKKSINYHNKIVTIIGGGNTAIDISRTIKRLGPKSIQVIYRGEEIAMKADPQEVSEAKKEGIDFLFNTNITKIIGKDKVNAIEVVKTTVKEKINYQITCDYVIKAIGSHPDSVIEILPIDKVDFSISIDNDGKTSDEKVFAGGDITETKRTVAWASRSGRNAAYGIIKYLGNQID